LPDAQQLIQLKKDAQGSVTTREVFQVLFSTLEDVALP
jgi:protein-L-isoaspartate(D-aspartate) O-methyltransferase